MVGEVAQLEMHLANHLDAEIAVEVRELFNPNSSPSPNPNPNLNCHGQAGAVEHTRLGALAAEAEAAAAEAAAAEAAAAEAAGAGNKDWTGNAAHGQAGAATLSS